MQRTANAAMCAALVILWGCGAGNQTAGPVGPDPGTGNAGSFTGNLAVLAHTPADGAVQVAVDTPVRIEFDFAVAPESFRHVETGLWEAGSGAAVPGTFAFHNGGEVAIFTPQTELRLETDYVFRLSPLTADAAWRILDRDFSFGFRTIDTQPPAVAAASVTGGQTGVSRTQSIDVTLDEAVLASSVTATSVVMRDSFGSSIPSSTSVVGSKVVVTPAANLAGSRDYVLELRGGSSGVQDRAGNSLARTWTVAFETAADSVAPAVTSMWPAAITNASPAIEPSISFDEAIDLGSIEPSSIVFADEFASLVPLLVHASSDLRTLRLAPQSPLIAGRTYTITLAGGAGGVTDLTGNPLAQLQTFGFTVGTDSTPPALAGSDPAPGATGISLNVLPLIALTEPLDPQWITTATVLVSDDTGPVPFTATLEAGGSRIRITPDQPLAAGRRQTVTIVGGPDGVRDLAGNTMPGDLQLGFHTSPDATLPSVSLQPYDGNALVPRSAELVALFDSPIDPSSVTDGTVFVTDTLGSVPGTLSVERGNRVVRFSPSTPWTVDEWYTLVVAGGASGVREPSGNWLESDQSSRFRIDSQVDVFAPAVTVTLNEIDEVRRSGISVPPHGFGIDVSATDLAHLSLDMSSVDVTITGPGTVPDSDVMFAGAAIGPTSYTYYMPVSTALEPGDYTLTATVRDLSGNLGSSAVLDFQVRDVDAGTLPFERTQVFWVRFDLDRDGNGRPDLDDDLLRLGLISAGDPAGTNARMRQIVGDGILAQGHRLLGRSDTGVRLGSDSVALRLTSSQPFGLVHSQIACAGLDPEGNPQRQYGDPSSGTLGRAFFDYRNGDTGDHNTASRPGLGVFPSELFLFEARIHQSIYPSFTTSFARKFLSVCPDMGGTPAGSHTLDPIVLAPGFDYASATSAERARYTAIFRAADDWATATGTILAHEIGHAVGLVAEGRNPHGLHGDFSLHNEFSGSTDIMAAALGYDSLVALSYGYRDLTTAYLRQRLVMK